jgi:hypothetical protein
MKGWTMNTTMSKLVAVAAVGLIGSVGLVGAGRGDAAIAATAAPAASAVRAQSGVAAPGASQFTLAPAPAANGALRPYFILSIAPGRSAEDVIMFGNRGSTAQDYRVGVTAGRTAANSGSAYGGLSGHCVGPACWVSGLPRTVTLAPNTQEEIRFQVAVPASARPGQYLAGITATPEQAPEPVTLGTHGHASTTVIVVSRVIIGVALTVGRLSALRTEINITGVTAAWIDSIVRLGVDIRNRGQRFTKGAGGLSCALGGVSRRYPVIMDTVLPGDAAALQVNGDGMRAGNWVCTVRIKDSGGRIDTWSGVVTVPASVPAATRPIANGDYVAPPGDTMPSWAIVLMVLGGLILFSLWALILRRSHDRNLGNRSGA